MTLRPETHHERELQGIYAEGLRLLVAANLPFLVGGGFALYSYLGRWRTTKDVDIFIAAEDLHETLLVLMRGGFQCEITNPLWLAKARRGEALIDIIFCSYNGLFPVDQSWFDNARRAVVLGTPVQIVGPEEIIVSKTFVAARDRFDGADISWMIRATGPRLDWGRIERRMQDHWQVLLWQLLHFYYVFPSERGLVPADLMARLTARLEAEIAGGADGPRVCRGRMLDPKLYEGEVARPSSDADRDEPTALEVI